MFSSSTIYYHAHRLTVVHRMHCDLNNFFPAFLLCLECVRVSWMRSHCGILERKQKWWSQWCMHAYVCVWLCRQNTLGRALEPGWFLLIFILIQLVTYGPWDVVVVPSLRFACTVVRSHTRHTFFPFKLRCVILFICQSDSHSLALFQELACWLWNGNPYGECRKSK